MREPPAKYLELALNHERHDDCKQRGSFDERREDDRARLNAPGHLRLTRHAVHRLSGKAADTDACTNYCDARADSCAELCPRCRMLPVVRLSGLKKRKNCHCCCSSRTIMRWRSRHHSLPVNETTFMVSTDFPAHSNRYGEQVLAMKSFIN